MSQLESIIDTTDETFAQDVFERSQSKLVIVDFWAPWCAPCRTLGPILEKVAQENATDFVLVKANTDEVSNSAGAFEISGIPAVFAVFGGEVIDSFTGAMSEPMVRDWLQGVRDKSELQQVKQLVQTDKALAEQKLRSLIAQSPNDSQSAILLAELLLERNQLDECSAIVERLETRGYLEPAAERLKSSVLIRNLAHPRIEELRAVASAASKDYAAQLALARGLAGQQQWIEACEICLTLVALDRKQTGEQARELMIHIFRALPEDSPITSEYRRKLSMVLY